MSPVGGSRHYDGRGLGAIGMWGCPSCGEDNTGPLTEGCVHCGAGRPTTTTATPTPPVPDPPAVERPLYDDHIAEQGDVADHWARAHGDVSVAEAYRAGYLDGVRAARAAAGPSRSAPPPVEMLSTPKAWRTAIVALRLFSDQVLAARPEESTSGEWLTVEETRVVISELQQLLATAGEPVHV